LEVVPSAQAEQAEPPAVEIKPSEQAKHDVAPAALVVPAAQSLQVVRAAESEYVPAAQFSHADAPLVLE
jgi:hypothetical protein